MDPTMKTTKRTPLTRPRRALKRDRLGEPQPIARPPGEVPNVLIPNVPQPRTDYGMDGALALYMREVGTVNLLTIEEENLRLEFDGSGNLISPFGAHSPIP